MKQWFTGKFRGHYRGTPSDPSALSPYPKAPHFHIEVYEALVSDIELGPLVPDPIMQPPDKEAEEEDAPVHEQLSEPPSAIAVSAHHEPTGAALHQAHISKVHLIDPVRIGQTIRSTAHDVLMSAISLSHPAQAQKGTLGHIEGVISGWYRPPPEPPEIEEVPALDGPPPVGWRTEALERDEDSSGSAPSRRGKSADPSRRTESESPIRSPDNRRASAHDHALLDDEVENEEELDAVLSEEKASPEYPFFAIGMGITLLLAFFARPFAAVLFGLTFLFSYGARRWLLGVVPDIAGIRVLSLLLGSTQILVAALLIARWASHGCVSLSPLPLIWLLGAQMAASLLPRPLPFALTTAGFAAVLLQAYANWAPPSCAARGDSGSDPSTLSEPAKETGPLGSSEAPATSGPPAERVPRGPH